MYDQSFSAHACNCCYHEWAWHWDKVFLEERSLLDPTPVVFYVVGCSCCYLFWRSVLAFLTSPEFLALLFKDALSRYTPNQRGLMPA